MVADGRIEARREQEFRDRWTTWGRSTGIRSLSERPTPERLRQIELFAPYDDAFLEKISPDVSLAEWEADRVLFEQGSYIDLAFFIVEGEVDVSLGGVERPPAEQAPIFDVTRTFAGPLPAAAAGAEERPPAADVTRPERTLASETVFLATMEFNLGRGELRRLSRGELFGEIGALSGWPQSVTARTASACTLAQIRLPALREMRLGSKALKQRLDRIYRERELFAQLATTPLLRDCPPAFIGALAQQVELVSCNPGEEIVTCGSSVEAIYLVRSGFVKLIQPFGNDEMVVSYLSKGMALGDVEQVAAESTTWLASARSVEYAELVAIPLGALRELLRLYPASETQLWQSGVARIKEYGATRHSPSRSEFTDFALEAGLVQGNSILVMDLDVCTRCDDCVRACAATHGGRPRFVREGDKYRHLLIAKSCYHCRDPVCLVGCPTGAIHRSGSAEVVSIQDDICIGCQTCASNCPYDQIVMHDTGELWPADAIPEFKRGKPRLVASKCDLCQDTGHGPACVSNCPQNCAYRVSSVEEFQELLEARETRRGRA